MTEEEYEAMLDRRDWEVHFWRWDFHELSQYTGADSLLYWMPDEMLDHVLPTNRTVRQHLELIKAAREEIVSQPERRFMAAFDQKLTPVQYRRKFDPLTGEWASSNPEEEK